MKSMNSRVSGDISRYIRCPAARISSGVPVGAGLPSGNQTPSSQSRSRSTPMRAARRWWMRSARGTNVSFTCFRKAATIFSS